jgi:acyl-CoA thioesterase FadM
MDDVLDIVTAPEQVKGASVMLHQKVMRAADLLV